MNTSTASSVMPLASPFLLELGGIGPCAGRGPAAFLLQECGQKTQKRAYEKQSQDNCDHRFSPKRSLAYGMAEINQPLLDMSNMKEMKLNFQIRLTLMFFMSLLSKIFLTK
jgi:hypothetical protein